MQINKHSAVFSTNILFLYKVMNNLFEFIYQTHQLLEKQLIKALHYHSFFKIMQIIKRDFSSPISTALRMQLLPSFHCLKSRAQ